MARILVIDDSRDTLEMLRVILQERGNHEVFLSNNGKDGLEKAVAEHPDLAIIDVMMPEMTGYEVVGRIRANARIADLPVIILTARGQPVDKIAAMEAGADLHMSKPVDVEDLLEQIDILLGANKKQGEGVIIAVFSLRGGIGTTTVAVNLALLLQQIKPTLLLDLSPNTGHCGPCLGAKTIAHWGMLADEGMAALKNLTQTHASGLKLLLAPPTPVEKDPLSHQEVKLLLDGLQRIAHFIVIDMPSAISPTAQLVLEKAHHIVLISGDDPPSIQTTRQTLQMLKAYQRKVTLIFNAVSQVPHPPKESLQKALSLPIALQVPYDPQQIKALHMNKPLATSAAQSPFVVAIKSLIKQLLQKP